MIASITMLADAFHETARTLVSGQRQRLRVVAARLLEGAEDPTPLLPSGGALDCTLISLGIGEQADALRLLVCRQPSFVIAPSSSTLAGLMANAIAMKIISWTTATVGFAMLPAPQGGWPDVLALAAQGIRSPAPGIGVVVAELGMGDARCQVLACLLGDQQAGIAQWVPSTAIKGV
ncbi:MAG TPA: hypothetical protein VHX44_15720 [Planctomycetota bacterium]|nr:hypothetical protein [Planctomycetota bacterium]